MVFGFISDAHGNYLGLKKCLDFFEKRADEIYFLGDAVGYFPFPNEVIDQLREVNARCIMGNHDAMLAGLADYDPAKEDIYKLKESREKISGLNFRFLRQWPPFLELETGGKKLLLVHGSPDNQLQGYIYPDTALTPYASLAYSYIFMGHTHRSFIRDQGKTKWVNVGSCGFSRDHGNKITAVLFDTISGEVDFRHFIIDMENTINTFAPFIHDSVINIFRRNNIS